tara:strand:- start:351 stop:599 length:249 start_codon:yes stop_codon:yes gene_type:complete
MKQTLLQAVNDTLGGWIDNYADDGMYHCNNCQDCITALDILSELPGNTPIEGARKLLSSAESDQFDIALEDTLELGIQDYDN